MLPAIGVVVAGVVVLVLMLSLFDGSRPATSLVAGECFRLPEDDVIYEVDRVECTEPHELEVIGSVELGGGAYRGDSQVLQDAVAACEPLFPGYVGSDYDTSIWFLNALTPTAESWNDGDRTATCLVFQIDQDFEYLPVTGSARNDGR